MVCKHCGTDCTNVAFCPNCGTRVEEAAQVPLADIFAAPDPMTTTEEIKSPGKGLGIAALVLGILSLVTLLFFCCCGVYSIIASILLSLAFGILALILGTIGKRKSAAVGFSNTPAKVGTILATIGVIVCAIFILLFLLLAVAYVVLVFLGIGMRSPDFFEEIFDEIMGSSGTYY